MQRYTLKQCNVQQIMEDRPVLRGPHVGCHVGLVLHSDRGLHLYFDGTDQGVFGTDVPDPCYFMFDLTGYCTKVLCSSFHTKHVLHRPLSPPRLLDLLLFALLFIFSSSLSKHKKVQRNAYLTRTHTSLSFSSSLSCSCLSSSALSSSLSCSKVSRWGRPAADDQ